MKEKRKLFKGNWSYKEGFVISFALVIIALVMEYITKGKGFAIPSWPYNLAGIISFTAFLGVLSSFQKTSKIIKFLGNVPAAISSIVLVTILAVILGSIPQETTDSEFLNLTGLGHLTTSYLYVFGYLYFLITLGLATFKRIYPLKVKNIGYLLNHLGLYIIIVGGVAGSGDMKRMYFVLYEDSNQFTNIAVNEANEKYQLPISIKLNKFNIEEYNPKLVVVETETGDFESMDNKIHYEIDTNEIAHFENWDIYISKFYKYAHYDVEDGVFKASNEKESLPVAFIKAVNKVTKDTLTDWLTCGNNKYQRKSMYLDKGSYLAMLSPETKVYMSDIEVKDKEGKIHKLTLKVNEPAKIDGWDLYQTGYNEALGKWSDYSIIEAGNDGWLPVVYVGIFMLMFGSIYILWIGKEIGRASCRERV